jgi:hypothetical protein
MAPAMTTKAEFLAPLILTSPLRGWRPQIFNTGWSLSGEDGRLDEFRAGVMGLPSISVSLLYTLLILVSILPERFDTSRGGWE